jgi:PadR family transcriptional regulator PadR
MMADEKLKTDLLTTWEETYKKGQLTLWIFLALRDGDKYMNEIKRIHYEIF